MAAAAYWDGTQKETVFAAVPLPSKKAMQGYGHWPGLLVGYMTSPAYNNAGGLKNVSLVTDCTLTIID
eukprot:6214394-Pleurochrysis_carterae.AAC.2